MIKYFISYKNLMNDNSINKDINLYSPELKILKKVKNGLYKEMPLLYFIGYTENLLMFVDKIENRKANLTFMVELTEEESKKLNPLFIKKYELTDNNNLKEIKNNRKLQLLNFNILINLKPEDISNGRIVVLKNLKKDFKIISLDSKEKSTMKRKSLKKDHIANDIYFYTEEKNVLEKYSDASIELKEIDSDRYKVLKHKIFIIDSISQDRIIDLTNNTYRCLYELCNSSIPVYMIEEDGKYEILSNKKVDHSKKGYLIISENLETILHNASIEPLLKYINVYELENDKYLKKSLEEYMKEHTILKYIKKPSQN